MNSTLAHRTPHTAHRTPHTAHRTGCVCLFHRNELDYPKRQNQDQKQPLLSSHSQHLFIPLPVFLLLFTFFVLLACTPPKSSPAELPPITFSDPADKAQSIVGMREFLLSATASKTASIDFIASESSAPPSWGLVKDNPAKITRTFDNIKKQTRKIYFSVTDQYVAVKGAVKVDLSAQATKEAEDAESKRLATGLMLPQTAYYVHAYYSGQHLKTSEAITTVGYPTTSFPLQYNTKSTNKPFAPDPKYSNYAWNMTMWPASTLGNYSYLEVGTRDLVYIPFRYLAIIDQRPTTANGKTTAPVICPGLTSIFKMEIQRAEGNNFPETKANYRLGEIIDDSGRIPTHPSQYGADIAVFVSSPRLPKTNPPENQNQVLDAMVAVIRPETLAEEELPPVHYDMKISCFDGNGPKPISGTPYYSMQYVDD